MEIEMLHMKIADDDLAELNNIAQELIKQAAWIMDNRSTEMIALLGYVYSQAVTEIVENSDGNEWPGTKGRRERLA